MGFEIISKNKKVCFQENSEATYKELLEQNGVVFANEDLASQFIDCVSSYIIIQNMKV